MKEKFLPYPQKEKGCVFRQQPLLIQEKIHVFLNHVFIGSLLRRSYCSYCLLSLKCNVTKVPFHGMKLHIQKENVAIRFKIPDFVQLIK